MKKVILMAVSAAAMLFAQGAKAQTNLQIFYDFGPDRQHVTTTLEGFYNDNWGNTFFFVDHDFGKDLNGKVLSPSGTYLEIARCLNFWQDSALAPLSLQVEYNGGVYNGYGINNAFLAGIDYFVGGRTITSTATTTAPSCLSTHIPYSSPSLSSGTTSDSTSAATTSTSAAKWSSPTTSVPPRASGLVPAPASSGSSNPPGPWRIS